MRLTALGPPRDRAIKAREHAQEFLDTREDALIAEVWTTGTLRDRLELYRFLKPYAHGVAKLPADRSTAEDTFESIMAKIAAEQLMKRGAVTVETVRIGEA
jgi:hypothetical protein